MSNKELEIGLKVILKIGDVEHTLTLNEVKILGLVIDSIIKKEQHQIFPIFPVAPVAPYPWRSWDIVYCGDTVTITNTTGSQIK